MDRMRAVVVVTVALVAFPVVGLAQDVVFDLGPEEFVQAGGGDIVVPGYSVPSFEDWNNDLLKDLIVGEGGSFGDAKVRVYLNVGTEADPCFVDYFYVQADGADLACPAQGCLGCFPRVVYWDEDDRKDLLVGQANGTVKIFLNVTDDNEPAFDAGANVRVGSGDIWNLDVGARATPVMVDWNQDGMLDIVSGALDGMIHVYYNCGCGTAIPPHFYYSPPDGSYVMAGDRDLLVPSGRSSPAVMDLDADGRKDLLVGNTDGLILFYQNTGTESLPMFEGYSVVLSEGVPIDLLGSPRSRPSVCHWTGDGHFGPKDGYWDLLVGSGDGKIRLYRGIPKIGDFDADGALDGDDFTVLVRALDQPLGPEGSPADLNNDGAVDDQDLRLFADLWRADHPE
ncbi:MAG: VCBS repeat-containing protein [Sedimentisphaerales bacterium]|nr:VCBS repeat-containing protein [Sedimentisphaerales bacterium]